MDGGALHSGSKFGIEAIFTLSQVIYIPTALQKYYFTGGEVWSHGYNLFAIDPAVEMVN